MSPCCRAVCSGTRMLYKAWSTSGGAGMAGRACTTGNRARPSAGRRTSARATMINPIGSQGRRATARANPRIATPGRCCWVRIGRASPRAFAGRLHRFCIALPRRIHGVPCCPIRVFCAARARASRASFRADRRRAPCTSWPCRKPCSPGGREPGACDFARACEERTVRESWDCARAVWSIMLQLTPRDGALWCTEGAARLLTFWRWRTVIITALTTISTFVAAHITISRPGGGELCQ